MTKRPVAVTVVDIIGGGVVIMMVMIIAVMIMEVVEAIPPQTL